MSKRRYLIGVTIAILLATVVICFSLNGQDSNSNASTTPQQAQTVAKPATTLLKDTAKSELNSAHRDRLSDRLAPTKRHDGSVTPYKEDDLYYLAAAICREAGSAPEEVQLLVANVIMNRVNSSLFPDTIKGVLTQYKQYGTMWKDGISFPSWADDKTRKQCRNIARRILEGERHCPESVLFQAEFKQGTGVYKAFPGYYFCYYE